MLADLMNSSFSESSCLERQAGGGCRGASEVESTDCFDRGLKLDSQAATGQLITVRSVPGNPIPSH